jgi:hypothetical protein
MKQLITSLHHRKTVFKVFFAFLTMLPAMVMAQTPPAIGDYVNIGGTEGIIFSVSGSGDHYEASMVSLFDLGNGAQYTWMDATAIDASAPVYSSQATAVQDNDGFVNSAWMQHAIATIPAPNTIWSAVSTPEIQNGWYLPSLGQMKTIYDNLTTINNGLDGQAGDQFEGDAYWTSTMTAASADGYAWMIRMNNGNSTNRPRSSTYKVRGCYDISTNDGGNNWNLRHTNCTYNTPTYGFAIVDTTVSGVCDSYTWPRNGLTYTTSQTTVDDVKKVIINNSGCLEWKRLILTLGFSSSSTETPVSSCDTYNWQPGGESYDSNPITTVGTNTYTHVSTNSDGCPLTYSIDVTIYGPEPATETATVCDSYTWQRNDNTYNTSGTYTTPYTDNNNCLRDSILILTINHSETDPYSTSACDAFTWDANNHHGDGTRYTESGTYTNTYTTAENCPGTATLTLTINASTHNATTIHRCEDNPNYTWSDGDGNTYNTSTTATHDYTNAAGCPSTDTLHLNVHTINTANIRDTACNSFTWLIADGGNGQTYTEDGTHTSHTTTPYGCDSIINLTLTVYESDQNRTDNITECDSYTWEDGITRTESVTGVTHTHINAYGCLSTNTLNLTIHRSTNGSIRGTACQNVGYTWTGATGVTYFISGDYTYTYDNLDNCSSTDTLHLIITPTRYGTQRVTACDRYTWTTGNGQTYTNDIHDNNTATHTYTGTNGCDSIVNLDLTIRHRSAYDTVVSACNTYTWTVENGNGTNRHIVDTYSYLGNRTHTTMVRNIYGCDSTITLHLTINGVSHDTVTVRACNNYSWTVTDYGGLNPSTYTFGRDTVFSVTKRNQAGCDDSITLQLIVNSNTSSVFTHTACSNFQWRVRNYNDPGSERTRQTYTGSNYTDTAHVRNAVGCDSTIRLDLTVYPSQHGDTHVVSCGMYDWYVRDGDGTPHFVDHYTSSGTYEKSANVRITDRYGCDSTVSLHLTVLDALTQGIDTQYYCPGYTYTWRVANYDGTNSRIEGTFTSNTVATSSRMINHNGCDSTVTLHLIFRQDNTSTYSVNACESFTWSPANWDGSDPRDAHTYTANNNTATATVFDQYGCDSVITLNLTIHHNSTATLDTGVCTSFDWVVSNADGTNQRTIGTYQPAVGTHTGIATAHVLTNYGCDSTITLNLTVHGTSSHTLDTSTCASSFDWFVGDYGSLTPSRRIGTYYGTTNNPNPAIVRDHRGCDSTIYLHLHMYTADHTTDTHRTCVNYTWPVSDSWGYSPLTYDIDGGGTTPANTSFSSSRSDITATVRNIHGCDSVIRLILIKSDESRSDMYIDTCSGFTWELTAPDGTTYLDPNSPYLSSSVGNQIRMVGANANGCDSVVTLHLTTHTPQAAEHIYHTACYRYTWTVSDYNGQRSTTVGTYTTSQPYIAAPGLKDHYGCDSTAVLHLEIRGTAHTNLDTSVCQSTGFIWYAANAGGRPRQINGPHSRGGLYIATCSGDTAWLKDRYDCDSIVTLRLTVHNGTANSYDTVHTCGGPYTWQVFDYGGSTNRATAIPTLYVSSHNRYHVTVKDVHGCDSTVYLDLYAHRDTHYIFNIDTCYSYTWYPTNFDGSARGVYGPYTTSQLTPGVILKDQYRCDSIVQLNINIHDSTSTIYRVDTCGSFTWNVSNYDGTGRRTIGTYTINDLAPGNEYISAKVYHLTNRYGCDSTATMRLYLHNPTMGRMDISSCNTYTWRVHNWDGSQEQVIGTYTTNQQGQPTARVLSQYGCDSTIHLYLDIIDRAQGSIDTTACSSFTFRSSRGHTYNYTASYSGIVDTLTAVSGCDSIVTLNLTVNVPRTVYDTAYSCNTYTWPLDGNTYTRSTTAVGAGPDANGCIAPHRLTLYILNSAHINDVHHDCMAYTWINNITYTETTPANRGITYTIPHTYAEGCDTILTLDFHLHPFHDTLRNDTMVCDLFTWNNRPYSASGTYMQKLAPVADGCDSVIEIFTVDIRHNSNKTLYDTACDSYHWIVDSIVGGIRSVGTYTTSNPALTTVIPNVSGCDSIITLNLTINNSSLGIDSVNECESYTWINGQTYTANTNEPTHTLNNIYGCDSIVNLHLTIGHGSVPYRLVEPLACDRYDWIVNHDTVATYYASNNQIVTRVFETTHTLNVAGCDSTIHLTLQLYHSSSSETTDNECYSYIWYGDTLTTNGDYHHTHTNSVGCDSVETLHLTINTDHISIHDTIACSVFTFSNQNGTHRTYSDSTFITHLPTVDGCDSILTLNVMVIHPRPGYDSITVCDSLTWNNTVYRNSSRAINTSLHDRYGCDSTAYLILTVHYSVDTAINVTGCDSYYWGTTQTNYRHDTIDRRTYYRTTNQGCDSTVELHLTILPFHSETAYDTIVCEQMNWNGQIYSNDGTYVQQLHTIHGNCDSTVTLSITIKHASSSSIFDTACDSYTWSVANHNDVHHPITVGSYYTGGVYDTIVRNAVGCDSTITMHLTLHNSSSGILYDTACTSYMWGGTYRTNSGIYQDTIESTHGCDSIVTLFLAIVPADTIHTIMTTCDSYTWPINGNTYNTDTVASANFINRFDCDSTIILNLTVRHQNAGDTSITACDSYRWINDTTYNTSTTDHYTIARGNRYGCDSTVTLHLTIAHSSNGYERQDVCDTFIWVNGDGNTYTHNDSIEYVMAGANVAGCDSTVMLYLTVRHSSIAVDDQVAYREFTWADGITYTENTNTPRFNLGIPNAEGCDSILELHLTMSPYPAPVINNIGDLALVIDHHPNGITDYINYIDYRWYRNGELVREGGDSYSTDRQLQGIYYVEIPTSYARSTWFRSNTIYLNVSTIDGIEVTTALEMKAAPNPVSTQGIIHVTTNLPAEECRNAMLYLYDLQGRLLTSARPNGSMTDIPVNVSAGLYSLHLITNDGRHITSKIIVR